MAKRNTNSTAPVNSVQNSGISYASKPRLIGPIIKSIIMEKQLDERALAEAMNVNLHTLKLWYKRETLSMKQMMKLSKLLGYDLLQHYRADVKPEDDPCVPLRKELAAKDEIIEQLRNEVGIRDNRITKLEGMIEAYLEVIEMLKKKGG